MSELPDAARESRRWIDHAEHDLLAAVHTMQLADRGLTDIVCFHCQQCAEKYLKALLLLLGVTFPKTHDLRLLLDLVPSPVNLSVSREDVVSLNRYVIEGRYPGDWEPITAAEAQNALAIAQEVRRAVRAQLKAVER